MRLVHAERSWSRTRVITSLITGRLAHSPLYERWIADEVVARSRQGPLRLAADGETRPGPAAFTISKRRRALLVMQPEPVAPPTAGRGRRRRR